MRFSIVAVLLFVTCAPLGQSQGYGGGGVQEPNPGPSFGACTTCPGCNPPNGYTWGCGYSCSTTDGECACRETDSQTYICMKSGADAEGGCGCFDNSSDPCCQRSPGL